MPSNQRAQSSRLNPRRRLKQLATSRKMIRIGRRYVGYAKTVADAERINAHIRGKLNAFKGRQGGAATESDPAGGVSTETSARQD
jgi:hypothetical protein